MTLPTHRLVDVHAHICDPDFDHDRSDVLARAHQAGIAAIVAVGETNAHVYLESDETVEIEWEGLSWAREYIKSATRSISP